MFILIRRHDVPTRGQQGPLRRLGALVHRLPRRDSLGRLLPRPPGSRPLFATSPWRR